MAEVLVRFPNGDRLVPAHMETSDSFGRNSSFTEFELVPDDILGWRFHKVLGPGPTWHAYNRHD